MKPQILVIIFIVFTITTITYSQADEGCTIGVASGKATSDGRPLVWKTRDNSGAPNNEVYYNTSYTHKFISVVSAGGTSAWMGVNEKGFAILNSASTDLPAGTTGPGNGTLMRDALGTCATVAEFQQLLDNTNITGRQTQANFGIIDSTGAAAIFETGGTVYWKYDANDSTVAPNGYVLRTNFALNGGGNGGIERYNRQNTLIRDFYAGDSLNYKSMIRYHMRDFSDFDSNPVPVPYPQQWLPDRPFGYIYCYVSICRSTNVSAAVIHGVLPEERAVLSTMWTILGQTASSLAVPYWPVGSTPSVANGYPTAPLCDVANDIRSLLFDYTENTHYIDSYKLRDEYGDGLWARTFPAEDSIFAATQEQLNMWRQNLPTAGEMLALENALANYAYSKLQICYNGLLTTVSDDSEPDRPKGFVLYQNYPNPCNPMTQIRFFIPNRCLITMKVYNTLGEEIAIVAHGEYSPGQHTITWQAQDVASGVYYLRLYAEPIATQSAGNFIATKKFVVIK